ncbi:MAG TPA: tetratricopeptide repeat protein [Terriglobia bacterium]|nr:tetratricopeptide repeat protein [Terriglobia bacterium]
MISDCGLPSRNGIAFAVVLVLVGWGALASFRAFAADQPPQGVILDGNEQLFCVLAALNAGGYNEGLNVDSGDRTRQQLRDLIAKKNPSVLPDLKRYYLTHQVADSPGGTLSQYISLALLLDSPPDFRFVVPQSDLPPDAKGVADFVPLLRTFYSQANLINLWALMQERYRAEVERYSELVRNKISLVDAYLRFPSGSYLGRVYAIYLDLLGEPGQIHARIYGMNYYLVVTPSKVPKLEEIRHQYLHFLLDPLATKYATEIHQKATLQPLTRPAPLLGRDFKEDFPLFVTECLIRSVELRLDRTPKAQAERTLDELAAQGFILARYFYEALSDYEKQESSISVYYKTMIQAIDPDSERERAAKVKFAAAPEPVQNKPAPVLSEEERLLNEGDNLIAEGKYLEAKAAFQSVLEKFGTGNERALYGLAVVYANTRKPDLAEEYFLKTLNAARDLRIVTWSHIYLGRIYDLKDKRDKALAQYRAASLTAPGFPDAQRAMENGLQRPFGAKPKP